ncbi:MAG: pyruvate ferredoxin oxidoreductase [Planctomycetota bacterium]|nr:MAG: pyruvate ferredoxin oxidoreductase [Planctomycetota bacterium]
MTTVINDFTINVATMNGSGSASSNTILAKTIFRMGVPVSPKNLFPSNIQGLPTWFLIRVTEKGYQARSGTNDVVIALNKATAEKDVACVEKGGVLIIDDALPQAKSHGRTDIKTFAVPMAKLAKDFAPDARLRKLLANMIYVGVAAHLLDLDHQVLMDVVADQFSGKQKVVKLNQDVVDAGLAYARENFSADDCQFRVETRKLTDNKMMIEGNTAAALGCLMAGCTFVGWYPITPSSSLCEEFISFAKRFRTDPESGEQRFAALQAEDELASLGLVLGAGWAGARSMTSTAGPGISLMSEFAGFGYYAEIPAVVFDVQRVGPSTGMPTRTQQSDLSLCRFLSHGDTEHIVLLPAGPEELYEISQQSFDIAEKYQTPVFVLTDLDMGMNLWVSDTLEYPTGEFNRGKLLDKEQLKALEESGGKYERYGDPDNDGVPHRTLPGTAHPSAPYFTRGSGHTTRASYTEDSDEYKEVLDRIKRKIEDSTRDLPKPIEGGHKDSEIGLLYWGSTRYPAEEAIDLLEAEGVKVHEMRVRALPLHDEVVDFVDSCKVVFVAEQNRDGQMADILRLKVPGSAGKIRKLNYYAGMPMAAAPIVEAVREAARKPAHV